VLTSHSVKEFLEILASKQPAPGGGSISALSGALAAGLVAMVCRFSISSKKLTDHKEKIENILFDVQILKEHLTNLIEEDTEAFNQVMAAFKLPKDDEAQKTHRSQEIQTAYKKAVDIPLLVASKSLEVLKLANTMTNHFNINTASDLGVGAHCADTGIKGALLNVDINLLSIKDQSFVERIKLQKTEIIQATDQELEIVNQVVQSNI
jgi:methenyltetrahydrofolate cyclohydrolase